MGKIIFEMSGLPGCGKSTLLNEVITSTDIFEPEDSFYADTFRGKWKRLKAIKYCIIGLDITTDVRFLGRLLFNPNVDNRRRAVKCFVKLMKYKGKSKTNKKRFLLSEGYIQCFLEILDAFAYVGHKDQAYMLSYMDNYLRHSNDTFFILVNGDCSTANNRIMKRVGSNSIDRMSSEDRSTFMKKRYENTKLVFEYIQKKAYGKKCIFIDSNESISKNASILAQYIMGVKNNEQ